jgi:hypothetical protein
MFFKEDAFDGLSGVASARSADVGSAAYNTQLFFVETTNKIYYIRVLGATKTIEIAEVSVASLDFTGSTEYTLTFSTVFSDYTAYGTFKSVSGYPGFVIASFYGATAPLGVTVVKTIAGVTQFTIPRAMQASKCTPDGKQILAFYDDSDQTQQYYGLVDWTTGAILATFAHSTAQPILTGSNLPSLAERTTDGEYECALLEQRRLITTGGDLTNGWAVEVGASSFKFDTNVNQKQLVNLAGNLVVGGGRLVAFDGFFGRDLGFADFPEQIYSGIDAATGGSMSDGTYSYKIVYEYIDAAGRLYRSAPSAALSVTVNGGGSSQSVVLNVPFPTFYEYPAIANYDNIAPVVVVYRTTNGGTVYYRTGATATAAGNVTDTESDANLTDNQILYTEGGYLDNVWPGATVCIAARRDRLFVVPADDRTAVLYSKPLGEGVGIEFSDGYYVRSETGGDVTGLACLDDKVVIFKENQIRYFTGDGPNAFGIGEWSADFLVTEDVGCIDSRSIVSTSKGIYFLSNRGLYLLDRGLTVLYVGAPIEQLMDGVSVTAACVDTVSHRVYFALDGGGLVVFDESVGQWCQWTGITVKAMCIWDNKLTILDHNEVLWRYNEGSHLDGTDGIPLRIETPWYKLGSIAGYQRIKEIAIMGRMGNETGNDLTVEIYTDYDDTTVRQTVDVSQTEGHDGDVLAQIKPSRQKCTALKLVIRQDSTMPDAAVKIEGLVLDVGVKKGGAKNRTVGL